MLDESARAVRGRPRVRRLITSVRSPAPKWLGFTVIRCRLELGFSFLAHHEATPPTAVSCGKKRRPLAPRTHA